MKYFSTLAAIGLMSAPIPVAAADRLSPSEIMNVALRDNASIKAARAKWEMMKARVPQAGAWEDLRAGVDSATARFVSIPANAFMDQTAMLEQEVPLSGKNRSRARAATAEAGAAFEGRSRYEAGSATQADVLLAQTDAAKLLETRADIERQISEAQSALNVLLNRPAQMPLGQPEPLVFTPRTLSLEKLQAITMLRRPELQRAQSQIDASRSRLELAHRQWFPDPALNVKAQRYNAAAQAVSEVDVGIAFPLPWLNPKKYSAGVLEARKSVESAQQEFDAARVEALGLVRDQLKKIQTSAGQYELYRDQILPVARQTVEASRAAYEANTGGFLELITTRRTLQDAESAALNHLADYEAAVAELDAIIGRTGPDIRGGYLK